MFSRVFFLQNYSGMFSVCIAAIHSFPRFLFIAVAFRLTSRNIRNLQVNTKPLVLLLFTFEVRALISQSYKPCTLV